MRHIKNLEYRIVLILLKNDVDGLVILLLKISQRSDVKNDIPPFILTTRCVRVSRNEIPKPERNFSEVRTQISSWRVKIDDDRANVGVTLSNYYYAI